jgi:hypothetical protein
VLCCGGGDEGQLGNGSKVNTNSPRSSIPLASPLCDTNEDGRCA